MLIVTKGSGSLHSSSGVVPLCTGSVLLLFCGEGGFHHIQSPLSSKNNQRRELSQMSPAFACSEPSVDLSFAWFGENKRRIAETSHAYFPPNSTVTSASHSRSHSPAISSYIRRVLSMCLAFRPFSSFQRKSQAWNLARTNPFCPVWPTPLIQILF